MKTVTRPADTTPDRNTTVSALSLMDPDLVIRSAEFFLLEAGWTAAEYRALAGCSPFTAQVAASMAVLEASRQ